MSIDLSQYGIENESLVQTVHRNASLSVLYTLALRQPRHGIASSGALLAESSPKTGRSPKDKRVVREASSEADIWWGNINIPISEQAFAQNRATAVNFLSSQTPLYVVDAYAGWDPRHRIKVRVICTLAYHALFMWNMLIRPTPEEAENFGEPDWVIFNAGEMFANPAIEGEGSRTSVSINFKERQMVILGTLYAGEMKKGIFTVLNYVLPKKGVMPMHCSANEGDKGDVALFFGLSGTGKTTLSADPKRALIGDDEHGWTDDGVFNFEGGCYAKTINLSAEKEPQIYNAIRFGAVLENVVCDPTTGIVDYDDGSKTENTRVSYPVEFIENAKIPCVGGHPKNIIFLTCDAFGVLPPVSKLTPEQAMYHFISGYTAKIAGTEVGVTEPEATFSACFGAAFMVWHPTVYAELLAKKVKEHNANVWLVNTGWTGGSYGVGERFSLKYTRAIINAVLEGKLDGADLDTDPIFGLATPKAVEGVPTEVLKPVNTWQSKESYEEVARKLAAMFVENFEKYADQASPELLAAAPKP